MYGWRARIGRICPSAATVAEQEWSRAAPDGVIVVCSRTYIEEVNLKGLEGLLQQVDRAAKEVASARCNVIIQCGTPAVFIKGYGYDRVLIERLQDLTGIPCTTMMTSVVEALRTLKANKVAVGTAYIDELNSLLEQFLTESGFEVVHIEGLGILRNVDIGDQPPGTAYRLGRKVMQQAPDADALFISCAGLRTFEVIEALEKDLGVPVVTSSQAAFWNGLRMSGVHDSIQGLGRLLSHF